MTELDKMEPRNKEKFKVQFAHKDRFKIITSDVHAESTKCTRKQIQNQDFF